jgi:hypothetical protein
MPHANIKVIEGVITESEKREMIERVTRSSPCASNVKRNFILQQGFPEPASPSCAAQYSALVFQPRMIGFVVLSGVILQEPWVFLALAAVLWWSAVFPRLNPFDAAYNWLLSRRPGHVALSTAPAPRRFATSEAGTISLAISIALLVQWNVTAIVLQGVLLAAAAAAAFGGFCLGAFTFHLLRGRLTFARRTLP